MIVKASDSERYVARFPAGFVAALLFGPDLGLVRERAERLAKTVVPDLRDPFRTAEMDATTLSEDPARLFDEAAALSMTGGRRVVRVRGAGNALAKLFESFLENPAGDSLVIVEGGDLAKGSGLRQVFERADNAAAIPCYLDTPEAISELVRSTLKTEGATIEQDALEEAVSLLGADRGTTRQELEKLALYVRGQTRVSAADIRAILGDEAEARVEDACDAAGEGDTVRLDRELERLWSAGMSPVGIVRLAMGHFQRLTLAKTSMERGESLDALYRRTRLHFSRQASFRAQLQRWSEDRLGEALDLLLDTEALCKTTAVPAEAVCGRALFTVAAWARLKR
jgi:DNA polymerase-3 subunit delta